MKRRIFLIATMVLVALTAMGQMIRVAAQEKQAVDLENVRGVEPIRMQPDTVMPNGEWQKVVQSEMSAKEGFKYLRQVMARIVPDYRFYEVRTNGQTVNRKTNYTFEDAARMTDGGMQLDLRSKAGKLVYLIDSRLKKQKSDNDF